MLNQAINRRRFLSSIAATIPFALTSSGRALGVANFQFPDYGTSTAAEISREQTWSFFRSFYADWNSGDPSRLLSRLVQSNEVTFSDATVNLLFQGIDALVPAFNQLFASELQILGTGNVATIFHASGDIRYGAIIEQVSVRNAFFSTNGLTAQRVFDFDNGLVLRMTDYSDSRELGESDIVGPPNTQGVAFPTAPVNPGGVPRFSSSPAAPGNLALTTGVTGQPSASPEMIEFAQRFHAALKAGNTSSILSFFAEDAVYSNPIIHQGPVLYGNFDQTLQIEGAELIAKFFFIVGGELPDCLGSSLIHIVGGESGGGFEWKAGGPYSKTGINRNGLNGSTAIDLYKGKIRRMSVKFDTYQLPTASYNQIRSKLAAAGIVDQTPNS